MLVSCPPFFVPTPRRDTAAGPRPDGVVHASWSLPRLPFGEGLPAPASAVQNALGEGCASLHEVWYCTNIQSMPANPGWAQLADR